MIRSLIPSLPFSLRYPRDIAVYPETSQLSVFPFTQSHHHATNAVHVAVPISFHSLAAVFPSVSQLAGPFHSR